MHTPLTHKMHYHTISYYAIIVLSSISLLRSVTDIGSPHSYEQLHSWREFVKQNYTMQIIISHRHIVTIWGYIPEWQRMTKKE
jgi:hypothetical protein